MKGLGAIFIGLLSAFVNIHSPFSYLLWALRVLIAPFATYEVCSHEVMFTKVGGETGVAFWTGAVGLFFILLAAAFWVEHRLGNSKR